MPMSRSRSTSRGRERERERDRRRERSRSHDRGRRDDRYEEEEPEGVRVHVGDLSPEATEKDLERVFEKYGPLNEVWMARNPPCFAFVAFKHREDADEAIRDMDGRSIAGERVRVSLAKPRRLGRGGYSPGMRCYTCGSQGHFARDCDGGRRGRNEISRYRSRSRSPRNRRRYSRSPRRY